MDDYTTILEPNHCYYHPSEFEILHQEIKKADLNQYPLPSQLVKQPADLHNSEADLLPIEELELEFEAADIVEDKVVEDKDIPYLPLLDVPILTYPSVLYKPDPSDEDNSS